MSSTKEREMGGLNKFSVFALANVITIFMLAWTGLIPGWMVVIPVLQMIPLLAWADDYNEGQR
jgi:hypothetical protein